MKITPTIGQISSVPEKYRIQESKHHGTKSVRYFNTIIEVRKKPEIILIEGTINFEAKYQVFCPKCKATGYMRIDRQMRDQGLTGYVFTFEHSVLCEQIKTHLATRYSLEESHTLYEEIQYAKILQTNDLVDMLQLVKDHYSGTVIFSLYTSYLICLERQNIGKEVRTGSELYYVANRTEGFQFFRHHFCGRLFPSPGDRSDKVTEAEHYIYTCDQWIQNAKNSPNYNFDGTFRIAIKGFRQLFIVAASKDGATLPIAVILMKGSTAREYESVLSDLSHTISVDFDPSARYIVDFEFAESLALKRVFGRAIELQGCYFHFTQSLNKQAKSIAAIARGGTKKTFSDPQKRLVFCLVRFLQSLPFVSDVIYIHLFFDFIYFSFKNPYIKVYLEYFHRTYLVRFTPDFWHISKLNNDIRTNCGLERFNEDINIWLATAKIATTLGGDEANQKGGKPTVEEFEFVLAHLHHDKKHASTSFKASSQLPHFDVGDILTLFKAFLDRLPTSDYQVAPENIKKAELIIYSEFSGETSILKTKYPGFTVDMKGKNSIFSRLFIDFPKISDSRSTKESL